MDSETSVLIVVLAGLAGLILLILTILVPVNVYLAQRNANKCVVELKHVNEKLGTVHADLKVLNKSVGLLAGTGTTGVARTNPPASPPAP